MTLYNKKTQDEWRRILALNLPKGLAFQGAGIPETNMFHILNAHALVLSYFDQWLSEQVESMIINEDSKWLDYYWDKYGIGKYMTKPSELDVQAETIIAFASARRGLFTLEQFVDFFKAVFGDDVEISISNAGLFEFEYLFPITFYGDTDIDWVVVVGIAPAETPDEGFPYLFEAQFYERDTRKDAIQALMEELVDINFRIVFVDL